MKVEDIFSHLADGLGTESSDAHGFDDAKKIRGIWIAFSEVLNIYRPEEYLKEETLNFSGKVSAVPEDYAQWVKLYPVGSPRNEIWRVNWERFDSGESNLWTEKTIDGVRKIVLTSDIGSAVLRYIPKVEAFTSATDEILLHDFWARPLGLFAAAILLGGDMRWADAARLKAQEANRIIQNALSINANQKQEPRFAVLGSVYDEVDLFS